MYRNSPCAEKDYRMVTVAEKYYKNGILVAALFWVVLRCPQGSFDQGSRTRIFIPVMELSMRKHLFLFVNYSLKVIRKPNYNGTVM